MTANEKRQDIIGFAMYKNKINKLQLAKALGLSYPTMLAKLKNTGSFKLSEFESLCNYLNIGLNEFINPLND